MQGSIWVVCYSETGGEDDPGELTWRRTSPMPEHMPRCACGRWVSIAKPYGWFKHGEHGSEEGWVCARCVKAWVPQDGRGRGPEAGYCGVVNPDA